MAGGISFTMWLPDRKVLLNAGWGLATLAFLLVAGVSCEAKPTPAPAPVATLAPTRIPTGITVLPTPTRPPADQETGRAVVGFNKAYRDISLQWDKFHQGYQDWRQQLRGCFELNRQTDLRAWVVDFQPLVERTTRLEPPGDASEVGKLLIDAVIQEEGGLRALRDKWSPGSLTAFQNYEDARSSAATLLQQARSRLAKLIPPAEGKAKEEATPSPPTPTPSPTPTEGADFFPPMPPGFSTTGVPLTSREELLRFKGSVDELTLQWESFHRRYDQWQRRDGDCDAEAARKSLRSFVDQFGGISDQVFNVPRPAAVRTLAERLMEATLKEHQGLQTLRDEWRPYDEGHFRRVAEKIAEADKLRRQVGSDLDQLRQRYSPPER